MNDSSFSLLASTPQHMDSINALLSNEPISNIVCEKQQKELHSYKLFLLVSR